MTAQAGDPIREVPLDAAGRLALDLRRRVTAFRAAARRTRRRADAEAIHDLRVAARRIGAAFFTWPFLRGGRRLRRAARAVAAVRRRVGATREREVLLAHLRERIESAPPAARVTLSGLLMRLERRVARGWESAGRRLGRPRLRQRLRGLARRLERSVRETAASPAGLGPALGQAAGRVDRRRREALAALARARTERTDAALHAARIAVKKWRYAEECAAAAEPGRHSAVVPGLRALQESLGAVHDLAVLRDALAAEAARLERAEIATSPVWALAERVEEDRRARVEEFVALAAGWPLSA
jgi:CHAD domain-containing protein